MKELSVSASKGSQSAVVSSLPQGASATLEPTVPRLDPFWRHTLTARGDVERAAGTQGSTSAVSIGSSRARGGPYP